MNIDDLLDAAVAPDPDPNPIEQIVVEPAPEAPKRGRSSYAPPRERVGRPTNEEVEEQLQAAKAKLTQKDISRAAAGQGTAPDWADFLQPVTVNWLAKVFRMDPQTVKKRLVRCPSLGNAGNGRPVYDFVQASGFLVKPKMDMDEYIKSLDPAKLPNHINKTYWEAKRIRLKYELEAADAWATEDVLQVFGDLFINLKEATQLWIENLPGKAAMSTEQYAALMGNVSALQTDIHERLIAMPAAKQTRSKAVDPIAEPEEVDYEIGSLLE
jgi:hypothetical protein